MERDLAGAQLASDQFSRLASACQFDLRFPRSFEEWIALVERGTQAAIAEGRSVTTIQIDVDVFLAWSGRVQVQPGLDALRAYLILHRRGGRSHMPPGS